MKIISKITKRYKRRKRIQDDIEKYNSLLRDNPVFLMDEDNMLTVYEDSDEAATVDQHYFLQDIYFSKKIIRRHPVMHYDIGSRVDGFIAQLIAGDIPVTMLDIRPFSIPVEGLHFIQTDATLLEEIDDDSLESVSSLHAIEHFGLGRYGDVIDPYAWVKVLKAIQKKIKRDGYFYLALPIGPENVLCFNAHRVFNPNIIVSTLEQMQLVSFAYINDYKINIVDVDKLSLITTELGEYDCGLFCFKKV